MAAHCGLQSTLLHGAAVVAQPPQPVQVCCARPASGGSWPCPRTTRTAVCVIGGRARCSAQHLSKLRLGLSPPQFMLPPLPSPPVLSSRLLLSHMVACSPSMLAWKVARLAAASRHRLPPPPPPPAAGRQPPGATRLPQGGGFCRTVGLYGKARHAETAGRYHKEWMGK